jgi:hypothetical protein
MYPLTVDEGLLWDCGNDVEVYRSAVLPAGNLFAVVLQRLHHDSERLAYR